LGLPSVYGWDLLLAHVLHAVLPVRPISSACARVRNCAPGTLGRRSGGFDTIRQSWCVFCREQSYHAELQFCTSGSVVKPHRVLVGGSEWCRRLTSRSMKVVAEYVRNKSATDKLHISGLGSPFNRSSHNMWGLLPASRA